MTTHTGKNLRTLLRDYQVQHHMVHWEGLNETKPILKETIADLHASLTRSQVRMFKAFITRLNRLGDVSVTETAGWEKECAEEEAWELLVDITTRRKRYDDYVEKLLSSS